MIEPAALDQGLAVLLDNLKQLDVKIWVEGDRLRVSAPAGTLTADLQRQLTARKPEIVALLAEVATQHHVDSHPHARPEHATRAPLSFGQQRLWFLDQLEPGNSAYNIASVLRLRGALDVAVLQQALVEILRRHATLRTRFEVIDGQARQVVDTLDHLDVPRTDLRHLPESDRLREALRLSRLQWSRAFDLRRSPLLRVCLYQLDTRDYLVILIVHHIAADGWSIGVITRELAALYRQLLKGEQPALPALPLQYTDYAVWQRDWVQGERLQTQLDYWIAQLAGPLPVLELPTDHPYPAARSGNGIRYSFMVDLRLLNEVRALSRREGATLFMTLLAAFNTLLHRTTRQDDIIVGTPVANRNHVELEGLVGLFINNLVLRTNCGGEPTFRELLGRVRKTALDAFANQDVPFEKLVEVLQPERTTARQPLFQVLFALLNVDLPDLDLPNVEVEVLRPRGDTARNDLGFELYERPDGLEISVEYSTDLFEAETIRLFCEHYQKLLKAIVEMPDTPVSQLPLLTEGEEEQLLVTWTRTQVDFPRDAGAHHLFEAQAERSPGAPAVTFGNETINYSELNARANQLAHCLQALGVTRQSIVGVHLERSIDMVVAVLGVLKSGGAYLPLDPLYPPDRLRYMLGDSRASVLITQAPLRDALGADLPHVLCMDGDRALIDTYPTVDLSGPCGGQDRAYLLYTSGSTGRPKGVEVLHTNLVNFLCSMRCQPGMTSSDVLLSVTTLSFDICGLELFLPLSVGGRVVLLSSAEAADGARLFARLKDRGTTVMQATPATWRLLIQAGWQGTPGLRVLCGGEALSPELARQLVARCDEVWNMYGPTETTIWSTLYRVAEPIETRVPIGRPIANTRLYVLDDRLQPVPIGVRGELFIGGEGVARGYLNQPELTGQRFLPDPFTPASAARMYRTGDQVRYRADGALEYLERLDTQVKLRGYRIELGEIETVLDELPGVQQAIVAVREPTPGDKRLVGYVVADGPSKPSSASVREALRERLPGYMLPSTIVVLERFPLTPNGKVDRNALPSPAADGSDVDRMAVPPRNHVERTIATVWQEVLHVDHVGATDNFFDLGGHSLLILQVHSRLCERLGSDLSVAEMFQFPTVEALAKRVQPNSRRMERVVRGQDRAQQFRAALSRRAQPLEEPRYS